MSPRFQVTVLLWALCSFVVLVDLGSAQPPRPQPVIRRFGASMTRTAVTVDHAHLGHTTQLTAGDSQRTTVNDEIADVLGQLTKLLTDCGSSPNDLIKVNLYAVDNRVTAAALDLLSDWCPDRAQPAVSTVTTRLPNERRFALDAVFVARKPADIDTVLHRRVVVGDGAAQRSRISVLPRGDVVYVSGQAQPGDLATATRRTLAGLLATLKFLELDRAAIVQVKCFLQPMSQVAVVDREIEQFFRGSSVPAVSHVEWITGGSRPIEIELVAAAPLTETTQTVSYATPPDLTASPVFSRIARIHGNRRIYVAGLVAEPADAGARDAGPTDEGPRQVHAIFQELIRQLKPARSNLRHLAKATYYVSNDDVSTALNKTRPHYYDGQRPPAASKAMVAGIGLPGRQIAVDIIAAPEGPLVSVLTPRTRGLRPTRKVVYKSVADRQLQLHVFEPPDHQPTDKRPVFLAIHGGGWTGGSAPGFYPFAAHFADRGMLGISLEYRLLRDKPGTTVFDCVRDARSAVRWIRENSAELGADPDRVVVMGGSAGGHLAVATALFADVNEATDHRGVSAQPNAMILMYPVIDTSADGYGQAKIGHRWRELSPLHQVRGGLPPALIFHGTADAVTPFPGAEQFHHKSMAAGNTSQLVIHPGGRHGYLIFDEAEFDRSLQRMEQFLVDFGQLPAN